MTVFSVDVGHVTRTCLCVSVWLHYYLQLFLYRQCVVTVLYLPYVITLWCTLRKHVLFKMLDYHRLEIARDKLGKISVNYCWLLLCSVHCLEINVVQCGNIAMMCGVYMYHPCKKLKLHEVLLRDVCVAVRVLGLVVCPWPCTCTWLICFPSQNTSCLHAYAMCLCNAAVNESSCLCRQLAVKGILHFEP